MLYWLRFPFIRFVIFFISGILLYNAFPGNNSRAYQALGCLLIIYLAILILLRKDRFRKYNNLPGLLSMAILCLSGYLISASHDAKNLAGHLVNYNDTIDCYSGKIREFIQEDSSQLKFIIQCRFVRKEHSWTKRRGKIMVIIFKKQAGQTTHVKAGDLVVIRGTPQRISPPGNPRQFDYAKFMGRNNIFYLHRPAINDVVVLSRNHGFNAMYFFRDLSQRLYRILASHIPDRQTCSLVSALTLGVKDHLDESTIAEFSKAGISHILAVSGLHVGILYLVLVILLRPLYINPRTGPAASSAIILVLICYAFITGLSPSVLRSVVMFSFIEAGRRLRRKAVSLNTLAASAFFLLCINPNFIYSIGFQLSYLAVGGILIFQPPVYRLINLEKSIPDYIWQLISVSIAAQLVTLPLTLYYFHSYPVYFIFANIVAIPASFILLITGFSIIGLNFIPWIGSMLGMIATWVTWLLSKAIHWLTLLPHSQINDVYLGGFMVVCLFLFLLMIAMLIHEKKVKYFYGSAVIILSFSIAVFQYRHSSRHQEKIIFYQWNSGPLIELVRGRSGIIVKDRERPAPDARIRNIIGNYCLAEKHPARIPGISELPALIPCSSQPGFEIIVWNGKILCIIYDSRKIIRRARSRPLHVDFILLTHNSAYGTAALLDAFSSKNWLIDGSNRPASIAIARTVFQSHNFAPLWIPEQGAVTFNFPRD